MHQLVTFFSYTFKECDVESIIQLIFKECCLTHLQSTCFAKSSKIGRKATAVEFVFLLQVLQLQLYLKGTLL